MRELDKYFLQPGYMYISENPCVISTVLGSCVAVCLWDSVNHFGGMNHYIYSQSSGKKRSTRYGDIAIPYLVKLLCDMGSKRADIVAHLAGGGHFYQNVAVVGDDNAAIAEHLLEQNRIHILTRDFGGNTGRKVMFNTFNGHIVVYKGIAVRESDWYGDGRQSY